MARFLVARWIFSFYLEAAATSAPTLIPTPAPTVAPTPTPSVAPSVVPSAQPTTPEPSRPPTRRPTFKPTQQPTPAPTAEPTHAPTIAPTAAPTAAPTLWPTPFPSLKPTPSPTPTDYTPAPTRGDCRTTAWKGIFDCPKDQVLKKEAYSIIGQDPATCCDAACSGYVCPYWMVLVRNAEQELGNDTEICCLALPTFQPTVGPTAAPTPSPPTPPSHAPTTAPTLPRCDSYVCPLKYVLKRNASIIYGSDWSPCCDRSCALFQCPDLSELRRDAMRVAAGSVWSDCCVNTTARPTVAPTQLPTAHPTLTPTPQPTQKPTRKEVTGRTVTFKALLQGLDYYILEAAGLLGALTTQLQEKIAETIRVPARYVTLDLSAGSVLVVCTITPPMDRLASFVLEKLGTSNELGSLMLSAVVTVPGIGAVTGSSILSADVAAPEATGMELVARGLCRHSNATYKWTEEAFCGTSDQCQSQCEAKFPSCKGASFAALPEDDLDGCRLVGSGRCVLHIGELEVSVERSQAGHGHAAYACYVTSGFAAVERPTPTPTTAPTLAPTTLAPTAAPTAMQATKQQTQEGNSTFLIATFVIVFALAVILGVVLGYYFCIYRNRKRLLRISPATAHEALSDAAALRVPRYWKSRNPYRRFKNKEEPALDVLQRLAAMAVPGSEVLAMHRVEDAELWTKYSKYRQMIKERRRSMCTPLEKVCGGKVAANLDGTSAEPLLDSHVNEVFTFHGSSPEIVAKIGKGAGGIGALFDDADPSEDEPLRYGPGLYLSDVSTKADLHAKEEEDGPNRGIVCLLLCRTVLGDIFYVPDDELSREDARQKRAIKRAQEVAATGSHDSVCGRQAGEREFLLFEESAVYPEYLIYYKRPWWSGWDEWR